MKVKRISTQVYMVEGLRLSFHDFWTAKAFQAGMQEKFSGAFIFDPSTKEGKAALGQLVQWMNEEVEKPTWPKGKPANVPNYFMTKGDEKLTSTGETRPEYAGKIILSAKSLKRPTLINRDKSQVTEQDGVFYSGCRVNAIFRVYGVNKKNPCIAAELKGVQFMADDEPFGAAPLSVDVFDDLSEADMRPAEAGNTDLSAFL